MRKAAIITKIQITPLEAITVQRIAHQAVLKPFTTIAVRLDISNQ